MQRCRYGWLPIPVATCPTTRSDYGHGHTVPKPCCTSLTTTGTWSVWPLRLAGRADDGAGAPIPGLCHLTGICVLPQRQWQHLGGRLLDAVLAAARQDGYVRATLWTHQDNLRAGLLFEARGFLPTGARRAG